MNNWVGPLLVAVTLSNMLIVCIILQIVLEPSLIPNTNLNRLENPVGELGLHAALVAAVQVHSKGHVKRHHAIACNMCSTFDTAICRASSRPTSRLLD